MRTHYVVRAFIGSLVLVASGAFSQTSDSANTSNFQWRPYVQGSLGVQRIDSPIRTGSTLDLSGSNSRTGLRGAVGFQLSDYWAVEGIWFQLPSSTIRASGGNATYEGSVRAASLAASIGLGQSIRAVARIGAAHSDISVNVAEKAYKADSRKNSTLMGVGMRLSLQESLDLTIDYDNLGAIGKYQSGDRVKASVFSVGLRYNF